MDIAVLNEIKNSMGDGLTCPVNISELNKVIELKNKLTKQLNNLQKSIDSITTAMGVMDTTISTTKAAIPIAQLAIEAVAFIPSTSTTPIPVGPILIAKDAIKALDDLIDTTSPKLEGSTFQLDFIKSEIERVVDLLSLVDLITSLCAEELSSDDDDGDNSKIAIQESVSKELLKSTQEQSNQLSPVVTNVNGFEIEVITVESSLDLKRRQAVAYNSQRVEMLKGDPSFSSNDQILINDLIFYIKQNKLKA